MILWNRYITDLKITYQKRSHAVCCVATKTLAMAQKGLTNKKGNPVSCSNFFRVIRNPLYKGIIKIFGLTVKGKFEPIVSEDLFDEVQHILSGRSNKVKHYHLENPDFPLRRFVVNEQGKRLTGGWSQGKRKRYAYYSFNIPGTTISKQKLEQKFMEFLSGYEFDNRHLKVMRTCFEKYFLQHIEGFGNEKELIQKRVAEINDQIDKLITLQTNGGISMTILADRTKKLETELEQLNVLLKERPEQEYDIAELLRFAAEALKKPELLWQKSPFAIKKKLQVFNFPDGVVFDGQKFRTPKVSSIFKLKELFVPEFGTVGCRGRGSQNYFRTEERCDYLYSEPKCS
jgi:site-specific DNA recombinase